MNAKRKGNRNEHRSIALLEAAGYRCSRSAASLGEWDIIANRRPVQLGGNRTTRDGNGHRASEQRAAAESAREGEV